MIKEIDDALLEAVRKQMSGTIPPQNVVTGTPGGREGPFVGLASTGFVVEEQGLGSSKTVKKEEVSDTFDTGGDAKDFTLSQAPVKPLVRVESPPGTPRNEPADYTVDYLKGMVSFREAPEKAKNGLLVRYNVAKATGETYLLKIRLNYDIVVAAKDPGERDRLTIEAIDGLYRERAALAGRGVEELRLGCGYRAPHADDGLADRNVVECEVWTTHRIEMPPGVPMGKVEISQPKKK